MAVEAVQQDDARGRPSTSPTTTTTATARRLHGHHPLRRRDGRHRRPVQHVVARHLGVDVHAIAGAVLQDMGLPAPDTGFKAGLPVPGQAVTYDRLFTMPEFETKNGVAHHRRRRPRDGPRPRRARLLRHRRLDARAPATGTSCPAAPTAAPRRVRTRRGSTRPAACSRAGSRRRSSTSDERDYTLERRVEACRRRLHGRPGRTRTSSSCPPRWVEVGDDRRATATCGPRTTSTASSRTATAAS